MSKIFPLWKPYFDIFKQNDSLLFFSGFYRRILNKGYLESNIPGVYGGLLFENESLNNFNNFENYIKNNQSSIIYSPYIRNKSVPSNGSIETSIIILDQKNTLDKISKNHLASIKKAESFNLQFSMADSVNDINEYYSLYKQSLRRWGFSAMGFYPEIMFNELFKSKYYGSDIRLWKILLNKKMIAGCWTLKKGNKINYWHACYDDRYKKKNPAHYLVYQLMIYYKKFGVRYIDLGPSAGFANLKFFKMRFNSKNKTILTYKNFGSMIRQYNKYLHYAEKVFKKNRYYLC